MTFSEYKSDNNYEYNRAQTLVYLNIMNKLMHANYEQKLEILKETWGEIKDFPKVFYYGDYCCIKIYKESEKIKFNFECSYVDLELLQQGNPEFGKHVEEKFKELSKNNNSEYTEPSSKLNETELEKSSSNESSKNALNNDYINLYRNINFKK